jgi:coproporphyrinogen III oxidase
MLTDKFLESLKKRYIDTIAKLNKNKEFESKTWDFINKAGKIEVNVSRGDVFEKACVSTICSTVTIPDRDHQSTIQWLGIETFPATPLVPKFMGVFEHVSELGLERCPGFFDVYPVMPFEEDKTFLQNEIVAVAGKHGQTIEDLQKGYRRMFRIKETDTGIGYGIGMAFGPEEDNFPYFQDAASAILKAYFQVVEKRKDEKFTPEQIDQMFKFRSEWVKFCFIDNRFFQGGVQLGVPPESFMLHMLPPVVKF